MGSIPGSSPSWNAQISTNPINSRKSQPSRVCRQKKSSRVGWNKKRSTKCLIRSRYFVKIKIFWKDRVWDQSFLKKLCSRSRYFEIKIFLKNKILLNIAILWKEHNILERMKIFWKENVQDQEILNFSRYYEKSTKCWKRSRYFEKNTIFF